VAYEKIGEYICINEYSSRIRQERPLLLPST